MSATARFLDRIDPRMSGLAWEIHLSIRTLRRGHHERDKQARILRELRAKHRAAKQDRADGEVANYPSERQPAGDAADDHEPASFLLRNDAPKPPKGPPIFNLGGTQRVLFAALNAPTESQFLFCNDAIGETQDENVSARDEGARR